MQRRHRLSRSRDFDAVYRHGRSVSTRFLTLYWFEREEDGGDPRLGLSVPKKAVAGAVARNRIKRRLRELWRARLEQLPPGRDYVLIVRRGLTEAAEEQGSEWFAARVDEVLGKLRHEARGHGAGARLPLDGQPVARQPLQVPPVVLSV